MADLSFEELAEEYKETAILLADRVPPEEAGLDEHGRSMDANMITRFIT